MSRCQRAMVSSHATHSRDDELRSPRGGRRRWRRVPPDAAALDRESRMLVFRFVAPPSVSSAAASDRASRPRSRRKCHDRFCRARRNLGNSQIDLDRLIAVRREVVDCAAIWHAADVHRRITRTSAGTTTLFAVTTFLPPVRLAGDTRTPATARTMSLPAQPSASRCRRE